MKKYALWLASLLIAAGTLNLQAGITNYVYSSDGDTALSTCYTGFELNSQTLWMTGNQAWGPAHLGGILYADSIDDPRATKTYYIENDTIGTWEDYHVNVYMDRAFSISNVFTTLPADWTVSVVQPVANATPVYFGATEYVGYITYNAGTLVPVGNQLDFQYDIGFSGSLTYRFADELAPSFVPEPVTFSFAVLGGLLLLLRHTRHVRR